MKLNTTSPLARTGRWLTAAALATAAIVVPGLAAHAEVQAGSSVWIGNGVGYGGTSLHEVYAPVPADTSNPGTPNYWAYCVEHDVSAKSKTDATLVDSSDYLGANYFTDPAIQGKVNWVLAHSYPALSLDAFGTAAGTPGISVNDAIEATQYAIWRYTDLTWDAAWSWETDDSKNAYWYLVNGANASAGMTPADAVTASVTGPASAQSADALVGPFTVHTNQATVAVSADPAATFTDAAGDAIDASAVVDGQQIYLDLRGSTAAGSATVTVTAAAAGGTGLVLSVPKTPGGTATADSHAQSLILVAPSGARTTGSTTVQWTAPAVPSIGTTLVDSSDQDHTLAWDGGTLTDTVAYQNLTPGKTYTVAGELIRKSDGTTTGITGKTTFTPTEANGTTTVTFTVPTGYDGQILVAYEELYTGTTGTGQPIAVHKDINDTAQTITINNKPSIGTTLVDSSDQDHTLAWDGGTLTDTVAYQNLTPGKTYTVAGELIRKSDGTTTGITGKTTFTPTEANGTTTVTFTVPTGYDGQILVAYEELYTGTTGTGQPIAVHKDINDTAQTITINNKPKVPTTPPDHGTTPSGHGTTPSDNGTLASTGGVAPLALGGLAILTIVAGTTLLAVRRRARS